MPTMKTMLDNNIAFLFAIALIATSLVFDSDATHHPDHLNNQPECDQEEDAVEECAKRAVLIGRERMPQSYADLDKFCANYKTEETCLRNHSSKCLSSSAHQTVTILINSVVSQNQKICSKGWRNKKKIINSGKCVNKLNDKPVKCLQQFIDNIQGIHQLSQNNKIPIICCNYHVYRKCATNDLSSADRTCNELSAKTIDNMIDGYSGEVINYVCNSYRDYGSKCESIADLNDPNVNTTVKEEIPKSFFSLMVKIYLS